MKKQLLFLLVLLMCKICFSQTTGDYRSTAAAINWSSVSSWQVYDGTAWVTATAVPTSTLTVKPAKITIVAPTIVGSIFFMDLGTTGNLNTTNLYINDGVTFQLGGDQGTADSYIAMSSIIINAGGIFTVPTDGSFSNNVNNNDSNSGFRYQSFYTQNDLLGTINANPGKFIGTYTFSHTPDANSTLTSYTQRLKGYVGNGTHPPASANVVYPPASGGGNGWAFYGTVLPLRLINFDVNLQLNNASLNWTTVDETNFSKFEVEKSNDGKKFHLFKTVIGKNIISTNYYSVLDNNVLGGNTYYRLKMIDNDGTFVTSDIKVVNNKVISFSVYPNPSVDILKVQFPSIKASGKVMITDVSGKVIINSNLNKDDSNLSLDIKNYNSGTYFIQIETDGVKYAQQFIKL
jgi:hypothetical protein